MGNGHLGQRLGEIACNKGKMERVRSAFLSFWKIEEFLFFIILGKNFSPQRKNNTYNI